MFAASEHGTTRLTAPGAHSWRGKLHKVFDLLAQMRPDDSAANRISQRFNDFSRELGLPASVAQNVSFDASCARALGTQPRV